MLSALRSIAWPKTTAQRLLSWLLLTIIATSLISTLLQQSGAAVLPAAVAILTAGLVGAVAWQHLQLRTLYRRVNRLESLVAERRQSRPLQTQGPARVTHFDSDQFFYRGQTKH